MINPDDLEPPKPKAKLRDLEPLSIQELEEYIGKFDIGIERDRYFEEKRISDVVPSAVL